MYRAMHVLMFCNPESVFVFTFIWRIVGDKRLVLGFIEHIRV